MGLNTKSKKNKTKQQTENANVYDKSSCECVGSEKLDTKTAPNVLQRVKVAFAQLKQDINKTKIKQASKTNAYNRNISCTCVCVYVY